MNIKLKIALGLAFTAVAFNASAQKNYTQGVMTISMEVQGQPVEAKNYFTTDSTVVSFAAGPANIKVITDNKGTFMAYLIDVPIASKKMAAVATPAEVEEEYSKLPSLTFAPSTETKVINGFNCKKVVVTDTKSNKTYDFWVTNDVTMPLTPVSKVFEKAGGVPIQFYSFRDGQSAQITVKSIVEQKVPAGIFKIPGDFDKITMEQLNAMRGGK
ncbi:MAG: DUF4412 domain-containing protein [Bacteroidota bacterium]